MARSLSTSASGRSSELAEIAATAGKFPAPCHLIADRHRDRCGSRSASTHGRAQVAENSARSLQLQIGREQPDVVGDRGALADQPSCRANPSTALDIDGQALSRRSPSERTNTNWRPTQRYEQPSYIRSLARPPFATTAVNARDGWRAAVPDRCSCCGLAPILVVRT